MELSERPDEDRNNRDIVLPAVKSNGNALQYASTNLQNDRLLSRYAARRPPASNLPAASSIHSKRPFLQNESGQPQIHLRMSKWRQWPSRKYNQTVRFQ